MKKYLIMLIMSICMLGLNAAAEETALYGETRAEIFAEIGYDSSQSYSAGSTGKAVLFIQTVMNELDYYDGVLSGDFGAKTKTALSEFQTDYGLKETGVCDRIAMYKLVDLYLGNHVRSRDYVYEKDFYNPDWFEAKDQLNSIGLRKDAIVRLVDLTTDRVMDIKIQSTGNHVDAEPLTAHDTQVLCGLYGVSSADKISYERRPMLLVVPYNGMNVQIVCSIYAEPHGADTISGNNFDGQFCLHLKNSKTHGTDHVEEQHQEMIAKGVEIMQEKVKNEYEEIEYEKKAYWDEILSELRRTGTFSSGKTSARFEDGIITVSGGTVFNVNHLALYDNHLPAGTHTVVFDDVVLKSNRKNLAERRIEIGAESGETLKVIFGENAALRTDLRVRAKAFDGGKLELIIKGSLEKLEVSTEEAGEMYIAHSGVIYNNISGTGRGRMKIVNDGDMTRSLAVTVNKSGMATIENRKDGASIQVFAYDNSRAEVHNASTIRSLLLEADDSSCIEMNNDGKIKGLSAGAFKNGEVLLINHGEISNECGGEDYIHLIADETGRISYAGKGSVQPGYMIFDYLDGVNEIERTPGEPVRVEFRMENRYSGMEAARVAAIDAFRAHFEMELDSIQTHSGMDQIVAIVYYTDTKGMDDSFIVRQAELYKQETGDTVGGEEAFEKLPPVDAPTLVLPDGEIMDADTVLKYEEPNTNKNNTVVYNVHLVNRNGEKVDLPGECILCFPYPKGLDENSGNKYRIIIHHYADNGKTEVFKSEDGDIEFTKQGLCIRVSSFSPFEISWTDAPEVHLPQTGDSSHIALWLALLTTAGISLLILKRKTA